jgi:hypothetical protein
MRRGRRKGGKCKRKWENVKESGKWGNGEMKRKNPFKFFLHSKKVFLLPVV